jgi:hypothetical protein
MSKQKEIEHTVIHPVAEKVGAIALTALSILVSFEAIVEHQHKAAHGDDHGDANRAAVTEIFARGETKGETARLPEEFDIGLQTPPVGGL